MCHPASTRSRRGAKKLAYLDFDGHLTDGTLWNKSIETPAFDRDGNLGGFSDAELREIVAIWRTVAEDYAPFDIDITTGGRVQACIAACSTAAQFFFYVMRLHSYASISPHPSFVWFTHAREQRWFSCALPKHTSHMR